MIESSDLRTKRISLKHGAGDIPALGFGTLISDPALTIKATGDALEAGFRHFDCAERYRNEREVGEALRAALVAGGIARKDLFITTKLWNTNHRLSASNQLSKRAWTGLGSTIWICISVTLRLRFNRVMIRIHGIKTATSFTTAA